MRCPHPSRRRAIVASHLLLVMLALLLAGCSLRPAPSLSARTTRAISVPVQPGRGIGRVGLLVEPDDGAREVLQAIRRANRSIRLTMYLLTDRTILHELEYAHVNGVDVRVLLEQHPYGAGDANLYAYNNLLAADIPVRWTSARFQLTHEKSMVVDRATAYIMTTNFSYAAFHHNREFDVVDRNPQDVAAVSALFEADWRGTPYTPRDANLPLSPINARALVLALIGSARHTLDIYAEELHDTAVEQALEREGRHGVRIRIILPAGGGPGHPLVSVRIRHEPASYLYIHAKALVADGRRAFVGSQNLSTASLDANRELGAIISDPAAIALLEQTFDHDWAQ